MGFSMGCSRFSIYFFQPPLMENPHWKIPCLKIQWNWSQWSHFPTGAHLCHLLHLLIYRWSILCIGRVVLGRGWFIGQHQTRLTSNKAVETLRYTDFSLHWDSDPLFLDIFSTFFPVISHPLLQRSCSPMNVWSSWFHHVPMLPGSSARCYAVLALEVAKYTLAVNAILYKNQSHHLPIIYINFPWKERFQLDRSWQVQVHFSGASSLALPAAVLASKRCSDLIGSVCICSHVFVCNGPATGCQNMFHREKTVMPLMLRLIVIIIAGIEVRKKLIFEPGSTRRSWQHNFTCSFHHGKVNSAMLSLVAHSGKRSGFSGPIVEKSSKKSMVKQQE